MADQFSPVPVKGLKTHNAAVPGASNVGTLPAIATNVAPTYTEGNQVGLSTDLTGALRVSATFIPSGTQDVNLTQIDGNAALTGNGTTGAGSPRVTIASDNTAFNIKVMDAGGVNQLAVDSSGRVSVLGITNALPAGTNLLGKVSVDQTTPGTTNGVSIAQIGANTVSSGTGTSGTGTLRTVLTSDYLSTAQISKNTTINSASNPLLVQLSDGAAAFGTSANPLNVFTQETPGALKDSSTLTSAALAAGGVANLDTAAITNAVTGKFLEMTASASVRIKAELQTITGAGPTVVSKRVFFVPESDAFYYKASDTDTITLAGNGSTSKFRLAVTNLDNLSAADVYGSITWIEV